MSSQRSVVALVLVGVLAGPATVTASGDTLPPVTVARARALKSAEQRLLFEELQARLERYRAGARHAKSGAGARPRPPDPAEAGDDQGRTGVRAESTPTGIRSAYPNVAINNRATDVAPSSGQAEVAIAALGNNVVATFNDGEGFQTGSSIQGYAFSTDGGLTWTDGGIPPTTNIGTWDGDPALAVNEKTGEFTLAGLCQPASGSNGIGVVKGTFSGGSFSWGTPELAISGTNSTVIYDKEWIAADSTSGNVYLIYARFTVASGMVTTNRIDVQRKVGANPFDPPVTLSSAGDAGAGQGARVAIGPNGDVWAAWFAAGPIDADFMRVRRSTTLGASWGAQSTAVSFFTNFGSGAPGFNRGEGFGFPALAVDRTRGPHRGRAYLAWNESINFYDDLLGQDGTVAETEPNDSPGAANPFTIGQTLNGAISPSSENDYWSFTGSAGQTIICQLHATAPLDALFRLLCGDAVSRLAFSRSGAGGDAIIVFTLPAAGTYTLRVSAANLSSGAYSIVTGFNTPGPERSRDHRDVFVCASDDNTTWSTPTLVNDDPPHFDNWFPEIAVGDGRPYVVWFDWRDAPVSTCGAVSSIYGARSDDGGATWSPLGPVSDAQSSWTFVSSNIIPNQGDYIALFGSTSALHPAWGDGRNGDPDVYTATIPLNTTALEDGPTVPAGLAIREVRPNPVDRELAVTFSLPGAGPARLELLDVSGRRVSERSVSGATVQTVALAGAAELPQGIYLLRLTQGGRSVVKRVSVLH